MTCLIGKSQPLVNRELLGMERRSWAGSKTCPGGGSGGGGRGCAVCFLGALSVP